jgi:hypothetical protein
MKQLLIIFFAGGLSLLATKSLAQKETKKWSFGILSEGGLPLGDAKASFKYTGGLSLRLSIHAGPGFLTLSAGTVLYAPKLTLPNFLTDSTINYSTFNVSKLRAGIGIPVKLGYKYIFGHHFFVMGEIGYSNFLYYYFDTSDQSHSLHSNGLTYAASAGFQLNALEIGIKYETMQAKGDAASLLGKNISNIALRTGFNF